MGSVCCTPGTRWEPEEHLWNEADSDAEVWGVQGFPEKGPFEKDFETSKFSSNTCRPPPKSTKCKNREVWENRAGVETVAMMSEHYFGVHTLKEWEMRGREAINPEC